MKKSLLMKTLLLLCALIVGTNAWADSYTITFGNNANSASGITSSTGASTTISDGTDYVASKPYTVTSGNCYYGGQTDGEKASIRVGKSGNDASLTIALSDAGKVKATSIVVNCMKMSGSKNTSATLAVNGMDAQAAPGSADDLTYTFASATNIENIVLTSVKAVFVYSITVNISASSKQAAELSYAIPSYKVAYNTVFPTPTLTNPNGLTVSYASSDEDIALVDENNGDIVIGSKAGTVTITATSAETATYDAGSASYTITVFDANAKGTEKNPYTVTEALDVIDALGSGVSTETVYVKGIVSTAPTTLYSGKARYYISVDGSATEQLYIYNGYGFNGDAFANASDLAVGDEITVVGTLTNYQGTTPEVNSGSSIVQYKQNGTDTDVKFTGVTADKYKSYVATENLIVPAGVTAYIATGETASQLTLSSVAKIKANTPVILYADVDEPTTYSFEITDEDVTYPSTNLLKISDGTAINGVYVLAKKNSTVGFYKWAGGALSPGKVYVEAPSAGAREYLEFSFDNDVTAIDAVKAQNVENGQFFNLAGQRVAQPTKGLYIVNGRKVIVK